MMQPRASIPTARPTPGTPWMAPSPPETAPPPHGALLEQARTGDRAAWDQLYRLHHRRVLLSLLGRGVPMARAQELCQAAWARAMARSDEGRLGELKLPGLLVTMARRMAIDAWRSQRHEHLWADDDEMDRALDGGVLPERRVADRERLRLALDALDALGDRKPRARQIFLLVYRDGLPAAEVARQLDISVQRVRQTLTEVRAHLRAQLDPAPGSTP